MSGVLLGIDTATAVVSVAVVDAGDGRVLAAGAGDGATRHAEVLTPLVADVLREAGLRVADLTGIAVGVGPGPFTGLRVGVVTALALGAARGIPVTGACSLDALALAAARAAGGSGELLVVTDARRREVYWARYHLGGADGPPLGRVDGPSVDHPAAVPGAGSVPAVGAGALLHADVFGGAVPGAPGTPDAGVLASGVALSTLGTVAPEPLYLRRPDARPAPPAAPAPGIART